MMPLGSNSSALAALSVDEPRFIGRQAVRRINVKTPRLQMSAAVVKAGLLDESRGVSAISGDTNDYFLAVSF